MPRKTGRKPCALNIKSRETEQVVRELAKRTGLSITEAVHLAATEKLRAIDADYEARVATLTPEQVAKLRRIEAICREAAALRRHGARR